MNKLYLIFFFSILIFSSCKHELETPSWDIDLITPIANSNVSIDQIVIEDSLIGVEAALNGGFDVFGYTAHDYHDELRKMATKTFSEMLILPELL